MLRLTVATLAAAALLIPLTAMQDHREDDRRAIERAALDYCEAFYEVKPEYIERSVHPELVKYGAGRRGEEYRWSGMNFEQAKALAARWNSGGRVDLTEAPKKVEVLDMLDRTAAVKLTAYWGVDYMQLTKEDDRWMIRHVIWQSLPE